VVVNTIHGLICTGQISSIISTEVKTAEETAKRVRTGVGWTSLSGKLYEKRAVRVRYNPPLVEMLAKEVTTSNDCINLISVDYSVSN